MFGRRPLAVIQNLQVSSNLATARVEKAYQEPCRVCTVYSPPYLLTILFLFTGRWRKSMHF